MEEVSCLLVTSLDAFPHFRVAERGCKENARAAEPNRDNDGRFSSKAPHGANTDPAATVERFHWMERSEGGGPLSLCYRLITCFLQIRAWPR
jgi:hypothetical protein